MINRDLIRERLAMMISFNKEMKNLSKLEIDEFMANKLNSAAAESFLRRTLEAIFDIGRHILAKKGFIEFSKEYKSIAIGLNKIGVIDEQLKEKLVQMAGYRNRLVHMYHVVTEEELYDIIKNDLADIDKFIRVIKKFVSSG
ncbi:MULTISPECIES: type VII toxin-antitoxin system HepT family RNase toxin [Thermodesulfovibrio]|jgi:uncharacterized protein YutE (UPF0331/DUF86 family)|uniref:type VII toxin-antitoxin system HepT family RNase toxin n=1 Tax=Thermodesulfovibrio TaxID=28261 RepID=UPI002612DEB1|nr:DUF86 domain-containing protein [Thermodesulfovibrio sp.]